VTPSKTRARGSRRLPSRRDAIVALLLLFYGSLAFVLGAAAHREAFFRAYITPLVSSPAVFVSNYFKGLGARPPVLTIDLKLRYYRDFEEQLESARQVGVLFADGDDFVPASVRYGGETVPVKIRLKGDVGSHLREDSWSFRVRTRGDRVIGGMKQFSLHRPNARHWLHEIVFQRAMAREGIIALRYQFIRLILNGRDLGVYAMEEHFGKELLENNRRRDGVILRFGETMKWREHAEQIRPFLADRGLLGLATGSGDYSSSEIRTFRINKVMEDPIKRSAFLDGRLALEAFRRGELSTGEIFDLDMLATFFALTDLLGAFHGADWYNLRFYLNPVTHRLEPIAFDGMGGDPVSFLSSYRHGIRISDQPVTRFDSFAAVLFSDPEFYRRYVGELERVTRPEFLDELFETIAPELDRNLNILLLEWRDYGFSPEVYYENQRFIRSVLEPVRGVLAHLRGVSPEAVVLAVGNTQRMLIELVRLEVGDQIELIPAEPIVLASKPKEEMVEYQAVEFALPSDFQSSDDPLSPMTLVYRVLGSHRSQNVLVSPFSLESRTFADLHRRSWEPNAGSFEFLTVDTLRHLITIDTGVWKVSRDMVIPAGFRVEAGPGVTLDLANQASIISYSPVELIGAWEDPIEIVSTAGDGGGFFVANAGETSILEHIRFENLSNPSRGGWSLTGAVTFYRSPVRLDHVEFSRSRSEDALNIVLSDYVINHSQFRDSRSDAFDGDFSEGSIADSSFVEQGNDGIDVSGSIVTIENVSVVNSGDKAISVGEGSEAVIRGAKLRSCKVGLASKDSSRVTLSNSEIAKCRFGLSAFQKKAEFGPATIMASATSFDALDRPYLVEEGSVVTVDERVLAPDSTGVAELLYGTEE
jgi:hypothetical protein